MKYLACLFALLIWSGIAPAQTLASAGQTTTSSSSSSSTTTTVAPPTVTTIQPQVQFLDAAPTAPTIVVPRLSAYAAPGCVGGNYSHFNAGFRGSFGVHSVGGFRVREVPVVEVPVIRDRGFGSSLAIAGGRRGPAVASTNGGGTSISIQQGGLFGRKNSIAISNGGGGGGLGSNTAIAGGRRR